MNTTNTIKNISLQNIYEKNKSISDEKNKSISDEKNKSISDFAAHSIFDLPKQVVRSSSRTRCVSEGTYESETTLCFTRVECNSLRRFPPISDLEQEHVYADEFSLRKYANHMHLASIESLPSLEEDRLSALIKSLEIPPNFAEEHKVHLHTNPICYATAMMTKCTKFGDPATLGPLLGPLVLPLMIHSKYNFEKNSQRYQLPNEEANQEEQELMSRIRHKHNRPHIENIFHSISYASLGTIPIGPFVAALKGRADAHKYGVLIQNLEEIQAASPIPECDPEYFKTMFYLDIMREEYLKHRQLEGALKSSVYGTATISALLGLMGAPFTGGISLLLGLPSVGFAFYEGGHAIKKCLTAHGLQKKLGESFQELEALNDQIKKLNREMQTVSTILKAIEIEEQYKLLAQQGKKIVTHIKHLNTEYIKMHSELMAIRVLKQLFPEDRNSNSQILKKYLKNRTVHSDEEFDTAYNMLEKLWPPKNEKEAKQAIAIVNYLQKIH